MLRACGAAALAATAIAVTEARLAVAQDSEPVVELSQAQTELKVREDVARRFRLPVAEVRVVESASRTWPDRGLGCAARRGVFEPMEVPGFRIVAEAGSRRFVYHTDRSGRLVRCPTTSKPLDRIQ
jgi:hypothetical protein